MTDKPSSTDRPVGDAELVATLFGEFGVFTYARAAVLGANDPEKAKLFRKTEADLQARLERYRVGLVEAQLQLEYLDERFPTGTTPPIIARISKALDGGVEG